MARSCVFIPKDKQKRELFLKLKSDLGYETAAKVFNKTTGSEFMNKFKDSLTFSEGVPTYESIMRNKLVKNFIGEAAMLKSYNKKQPHLPDTLDNVDLLISKAYDFNTKGDKDYIAVVDHDSDGNITIKVEARNESNTETAVNQYRIQQLNNKIVNILGSAGISMSNLSEVEVAAGRVGLTNFNHANDIANQFTGLLQVANNMEGHTAISEEFAHLIVGVFRNSPLVMRTLNYLEDENKAREVLGDEYEKVYEYYGGDPTLIAEEAAGHILQKELMGTPSKKPLFQRMVSYILKMFKGINPSYYSNSIEAITKDMGTLAKDIISSNKQITKESVVKAKRDATFNALSEKAQAQIDVLKGIAERAYKNAALQVNLDNANQEVSQKQKYRRIAESINSIFKTKFKEEETVAAIAAYLEEANANLDDLFDELTNIDSLDTQDRFKLLRNMLYTIQSYSPTISELKNITEDEYLNDEAVRNQAFVLSDESGKLNDFEAEEVEKRDTEGKSTADIAEMIMNDSQHIKLSKDETHYVNNETGEKDMRVTEVIAADEEAEPFDKDSPWVTPSTNIGTGIDELVRDYLSGRIKETDGHFRVAGKKLSEVYPNASNQSLEEFAKKIKAFKEQMDKRGITILSRDVTVNGTMKTIDGAGVVHTVGVAGTVDLLGYDKDGNWYLYDMKTHRSDISAEKKAKYARQLSLYKKFLETKYGIKIKSINVIPIGVNYPSPKGAGRGTAEYTVADSKPEEYNGTHPNQLYIDGEVFKGANPKFEEPFELAEKELNLRYSKLANDPTNGLGNGKAAVIQALNLMDRKYNHLTDKFSEVMLPQFLEFLKPFVGENIKIRDIDPKTNKFTGKMKTVSIAKVLKESSKDVSFAQKWLSSVADNPDAFLQIFDHIVKQAKDIKRQKVIEKTQEIFALGKEYEHKGVTSYDWMFESDKKNYINHLIINDKDYSYDRSKYEAAKAAYMATLDAEFGEHPEVGSKEYSDKKAKLKEWIKGNTINVKEEDGGYITIPNPEVYKSNYNRLSTVQKEFYGKWMSIKAELDEILGSDKTYLTNTIKIRKTGIERVKGMMSSTGIMDFVNGVKAQVIKSFDDDINYKDARGIRGFNGEEIMRLPLYYINANDTKDLSTDVIGTLAAYTEMVYNYEAMNQVVNPLEIGREIAKSRKIRDTRGDRPIYENFSFAGKTIRNPLYKDPSKSNFMELLDTFFESKIYGRGLVDAGETKGIDHNKAAGLLLKLGSNAQLGFNLLAGLANLGTGTAMQNIEAVAGEFFNARELAKADKEFAFAMKDFTLDIGQRIQTSKLALFDAKFNVRQNFSETIKHKSFLNKTILTRVFGPGIQYICQDAGDHWLYNRTAIAMALRYKLKDSNGKPISLWDAYKTVPIDKDHPSYGKKLVLKEGVTKEDGTAFTDRDVAEISGNMRYVNQHLFGIYNEEDMIAARRTIVGRFLMQYRDWIPAQFRYRFGAKTTNLEKGGEVEGYYRTSARFVKMLYDEVAKGESTIGQVWGELEDTDKANIKRAIGELAQFLCVLGLLAFLKGGDEDKDRPWLQKMLLYMATREKTELGALTPLSMPNEMITMMKAPFANTSVISDLYNLKLLLNPYNYTDTIKSGEYKDHSSAYRAFMRSPLTLYYRTIKRATDPEKAANFYK